MTTEDRDKILNLLREGRQTWLASLEGATNITQRPGPDRWSVLEIAEHVAIVEKRLCGLIRNAQPGTEPPADARREDAFATGLAAREDRVMAPDVVHPTGAVKSLEEATAAFEQARAETLAFVASNPDLRTVNVKHMRFGQVSGYEMAAVLASHPARHAKQVAEARAAVGTGAV